MSKEIQNKTVNLKQWQDGNEPPFNPEMEVEIKDFIGVFKKAFTKEWRRDRRTDGQRTTTATATGRTRLDGRDI